VASFIGHLYEKAARDPYNVKMTDVEVQQIAEQKFVVTAGSHVRGVSKRELVRVENAFVHKLVSFKAAIESEDKPILTKRA
jgi:hypothetical protein